MRLLTTTILALALTCSACISVPSSWIVPEDEPQSTPIEIALHSGRVANSWSYFEKVEENSAICPGTPVSVFLANDSIWVGRPGKGPYRIATSASGYDWESFTEILELLQEQNVSQSSLGYIQVAAADGVRYLDVITAMDRAIAADYTHMSYVLPKYLSCDFTGLRAQAAIVLTKWSLTRDFSLNDSDFLPIGFVELSGIYLTGALYVPFGELTMPTNEDLKSSNTAFSKNTNQLQRHRSV